MSGTHNGRIDAAKVKQAARGRELDILVDVAGISRDLLSGKEGPCPKCGGNTRARLVDRETGAFRCSHCFAEKCGDFFAAVQWMTETTFVESVQAIADYLGIRPSKNGDSGNGKPNKSKAKSPLKDKSKSLASAVAWLQEDREEYKQAFRDFCQNKQPVTPEGIEAAIGKCGIWPKKQGRFLSLAIAGRDLDYNLMAIVLLRLDGKNYPAMGKLGERKTHSVRGSKESWVWPGDLDALRNAKVFLKLEGITDYLAALSNDLPDGWLPITNTCGAGGGGSLDYSFAKGKSVVVVPDDDEAGHRGAAKFAARFQAAGASSVRALRLGNGDDMRDWFNRGNGGAELAILAEETPQERTEKEKKDDEYTPFPVEALPEAVRHVVAGVSRSMNCDPAFAALPMLSALGGAIGNTRRIRLKEGWEEPPIIWSVVLATSGTAKSPALKEALLPLRQMQAKALREHEEAEKEHEQQNKIYEADLAKWKRDGRTTREPPPEAPARPIATRHIAEDATVEAAVLLLENQPRGLTLVRDELASWVNSFDSYKSARGADVGHWLNMWSASEVTIDRKTGRRTIRVPSAAVSVCGTAQPKTWGAALAGRYRPHGGDSESQESPEGEHIVNGLAPRFLMAMPPRKRKRWTDDGVSSRVRREALSIFAGALNIPLDLNENNEPNPVIVPLSPKAKEVWVRFYEDHADEQDDMPDDLAAVWSKTEAYAARLALICFVVRQLTGELPWDAAAIDLESMRAGIALTRWFADEAARIFGIFGSEAETPEQRELRELTRILKDNGGTITARELAWKKRRYREAGSAEQALFRLVEAEIAAVEIIEPGARGGRPKTTYILVDGGNGTSENIENCEVSVPLPPEENICEWSLE